MSYAGQLVMEPNDKEPVKSTQVGPDIKRPNCSYRAIVHSMCFRHVSVRRSFRLMRCEKLTPLWFNVRAWKVNYAEAIMWRQLLVLPSSALELLLPIHKTGTGKMPNFISNFFEVPGSTSFILTMSTTWSNAKKNPDAHQCRHCAIREKSERRVV